MNDSLDETSHLSAITGKRLFAVGVSKMIWQRVWVAVSLAAWLGLGSPAAMAQDPNADLDAPAQPADAAPAEQPPAPGAHVDHSAPASKGNGGPKILIDADLTTQSVHVRFADGHEETWLISSGRPGLDTPDGQYKPQWVDPDHISKQYQDAPMPYAIFFDLKGHAFHGSYQKTFGVALSHGCIRLPIDDAKKLFEAVQVSGAEINITGRAQSGRATAWARRHGRGAELAAQPDEGVESANSGYGAEGAYPPPPGYPVYQRTPYYAPPQTFFGWGR